MVQKWFPRVCVECNPPHVEDCPKCFGWGFRHNGTPISAEEAGTDIDFEMCWECFGTPDNEDIFIFWGDPREPKPVGIIDLNSDDIVLK